METSDYDYAIVGTGAAGLQLILKMIGDPFFQSKRIVLIDKDSKSQNDHTWCFWEEGITKWDAIATHTWDTGFFINQKETITFDLSPYRYKMVRSEAFYAYAKEQISQHDHVTWIQDNVISIDGRQITGSQGMYRAGHVFDSRIPSDFNKKKDNYHSMVQHFKGWFVKTPVPAFDPTCFTMMDYRLKWKDSTSFTYVLPVAEDRALIEFTLFNDELLPREVYDQYLKQYIEEYLKLEAYEIEEVEYGEIPMSNYPFHRHHTELVTKIGTAGGWVRPSSGYSFKNCDRYTAMMIENIKAGKDPSIGIANSRFRTYDSIFLNVLSSRNDLGEAIFTRLYTKPTIQSVFRFLDEQSSLLEDLRVMFSLNRYPFWKAFVETFFRK